MTYSGTIRLKLKTQGYSDITAKVEDIVRESEINNGICNVFVIGSTAAIIINENDPMLLEDIKRTLEKISNPEDLYQHTENPCSHIRSVIIGSSQSIPVKEGKLTLGTWQNIMVVNFDVDDREREVVVTIVGD